MSNTIYLHQKNDVSVLFQNLLELWEQQSTLNYNLPLRGLIYFAHNIDGLLAEKKINLYGKRIVKIPTPAYYVLYNGTAEAPELQDLKLSDAFLLPTQGYEWTAHMLNINAGHNSNIMEICPPLKGYASLIQYIRDYQNEGFRIEDAVNKATNQCINEGLLEAYLSKKKAEVFLMLLTEFDEAAYAKTLRDEGREEGRVEGKKEGENRLSELNLKLISEKRFDDLEYAAKDEEFRKKLFQQYGL